jgi:hypothetical protein
MGATALAYPREQADSLRSIQRVLLMIEGAVVNTIHPGARSGWPSTMVLISSREYIEPVSLGFRHDLHVSGVMSLLGKMHSR